MAANGENKFVRFDIWCPACVDAKTPDSEPICNECLSQPVNTNSTKPINFRQDKSRENPLLK